MKLIATEDPSVLRPVPEKVSSSSPGVVESRGTATDVGPPVAGGVARAEEWL